MKLQIFLAVFLCISVNAVPSTWRKEPTNLLRVCYYTLYDPLPSRLNASLCTHIIAGFSSVTNGILDLGNNTRKKMYRETTNLKKLHPGLKILITVGGGGNGNGFSSAFNSVENRTRFIASVFSTLNDFNFDGLDVDWEFPVWNDNILKDKGNFVLFMKEFKLGAEIYAALTHKPSPLLSVAVAAPKTIIDKAYNVSEMAKYVDFINLMTYDFHDYFWYTPFTGHNSPLFNRSVEKAYFATLNTAWSSLYWNQLGMPKAKIMVGIPTYGHTYKLLDPKMNGVDAPAYNVGINGGDISFSDVCKFLAQEAVREFDTESKVPYTYKDYDWISYEDEESIVGKAKWIKSQGFGGAMTYSLNNDDWKCACRDIAFPLQTIIHDVFTH